MKAAFATRVNLVTQVAEVANISCWSKKLRIGTVAHEKIVSLQCFERSQSAPNKVIRENSCVYFLFFHGQCGGTLRDWNTKVEQWNSRTVW